jgi:hypothetical protein
VQTASGIARAAQPALLVNLNGLFLSGSTKVCGPFAEVTCIDGTPFTELVEGPAPSSLRLNRQHPAEARVYPPGRQPPCEVLRELDRWFVVQDRTYFPLLIPSIDLNLVLELTLTPR